MRNHECHSELKKWGKKCNFREAVKYCLHASKAKIKNQRILNFSNAKWPAAPCCGEEEKKIKNVRFQASQWARKFKNVKPPKKNT